MAQRMDFVQSQLEEVYHRVEDIRNNRFKDTDGDKHWDAIDGLQDALIEHRLEPAHPQAGVYLEQIDFLNQKQMRMWDKIETLQRKVGVLESQLGAQRKENAP